MPWGHSFGEFLYFVYSKQPLWKIQCEDLQFSYFIKRGRKLFSVKRNLFNICESKKEKTKFCNKLSIKVNLLVEFTRKNGYRKI